LLPRHKVRLEIVLRLEMLLVDQLVKFRDFFGLLNQIAEIAMYVGEAYYPQTPHPEAPTSFI